MITIQLYNSVCQLRGLERAAYEALQEHISYIDQQVDYQFHRVIKQLRRVNSQLNNSALGGDEKALRQQRAILTKQANELDKQRKITLLNDSEFPAGLLPRVLDWLEAQELQFEVEDKRLEPKRNSVKIMNKVPFPDLRYYQKEGIKAALIDGRGILEIVTGGGKTVLAAKLIWTLGVKTLIITPSKNITDMMEEVMTRFFGSGSVEVLSTKTSKLKKPISICNIQALVKISPEVFKGVDAVFIDEFHHCLSENTIISMPYRRNKTIKQLYKSFHAGHSPSVKSWNGKAFEYKKITNAFKYAAPEDLYEIEVVDEDGKSKIIECTAEHKILTKNGYKKAGELSEQDEVLLGYVTGKEARRRRGNNPDYKKHLSERASKNNKKRDPNKQRDAINALIKNGKYNPYGRGRYGNGVDLTPTQKMLQSCLNLPTEISVAVKDKQRPYHYKLDLADVQNKIGIEVDGSSHKNRKAQDERKDKRLGEIGWKILRIPENPSMAELQEFLKKWELLKRSLT